MLDHFRKARPQLGYGQGGQESGIHERRNRLLKNSDVVFETSEIDPQLSPNAGIHLRQECGWNQNEADTAFVRGGAKATHVSQNAPTEDHEQAFAVDLMIRKQPPDPFSSADILVFLTGGNGEQRMRREIFIDGRVA